PPDIRCFSAKKVPNSFDAKHACSWREYEYILPTELAKPHQACAESESTPEELAARLQRIMQRFEGCHSFHNFTRLKASDCIPRAERQGDDAKGNGKGVKVTKGKGKGKEKKGKGKKRKAEVLENPEQALEDPKQALEDPGQEEVDVREPFRDDEPVEEASEAKHPSPDSDAGKGTAVEPTKGPWVEVCSKDSNGWRHRPAHVLKHTQSTMHMMTVEPALGGKLLRIVLRGQFFLYNQIRLMVGTAVAILAGVLPDDLLEAALVLTTEMHMPMAPATGLLLRTAGFSRLDTRAGSCAMDLHQAEECMLPADGFVLMNEKASIAALDFVRQVEEDMDLQWKESKESESWRSKLAFLKPPTGMVVDELREMKEKVSRENAEARLSQDAKDAKRREAQLESLGEKSSTGLLPRRFAAACMVRFRLVPGWRLNNIQASLAARMRKWHQEPVTKPEKMSMPPQTQELLEYCEAVGIEELANEGAKL
ncbi:Putative tRNA pseudouridine synthase (tRNA pseudouridylate synthase) (tRNA-uridine isomerase), partial [Durusdinium trenchii]